MTAEILHDAISLVDDRMAQTVDALRRRKENAKKNRLRWGTLAACLCALLAGAWMGGAFSARSTGSPAGYIPGGGANAPAGGGTGSDAAVSGANAPAGGSMAGVVIPRAEVDLSAGKASSMLEFFIYDGRSYVHYEDVPGGTGLVGEYLGTAAGLIDEWTPKEGYVELAGSAEGSFYTVEGYAPSFMLCMQREDGSAAIFINDNGLALAHGADLFEDRLHLSGNYHAVDYQTRHDWYCGTGAVHTIGPEHAELAARFADALNGGEFLYAGDIPLPDGADDIYDVENYHLFFRMNNGMTIHLRLYEGGYVRFQGLLPVCVQVDAQVFEAFTDILETK